jgi:FMN phosphatase YigB (HAD superfamily)
LFVHGRILIGQPSSNNGRLAKAPYTPARVAFEAATGLVTERAIPAGDSIPKDVDGALAAGLSAVWVNRSGSSAAPARDDLVEISTLSDLPDLLDGLR